jgi:hypothetical protein
LVATFKSCSFFNVAALDDADDEDAAGRAPAADDDEDAARPLIKMAKGGKNKANQIIKWRRR